MTSVQISALIILILSTALLYWIGFRNGLVDGRKHHPEPSHPEKSGLTHSLNNRALLPALLRITSGIDAPVKNSLCCAAAGITKAFRATAGELIPHIKLREAAHLDAPLNAKNRPLAQRVMGYTPLSTKEAK